MLRPGQIFTLLTKNASRHQWTVAQDIGIVAGPNCFRRKFSGYRPRRDDFITSPGIVVMNKRSITWSQLLSATDKPVGTDGPKKKVKDRSDEGVVKDRANKSKESTKIIVIDDPIVIVASAPGDALPSENDKDKGKDAKPVKIKRVRVDLTKTSLERNFITPVRAMSDFLLKPSDLEGLRKTKRRSPIENEPPITVYWRKDVESRANEVWGDKEKLINEIVRREMEHRSYQQNMFSVKRQLRDYLKMQEREHSRDEEFAKESGLMGPSGRVVLTAVVINGCNFIFKLAAWLYTGSHSMFAECVHSLADTINQLILAYGIYKSTQRADVEHPYGYSNMRYVASLISGVGIFCVGTGLSIYHGVLGLVDPAPLADFYWAFFILGGSLLSEGATLIMAVNAIRQGAARHNMTFSKYILASRDPSVNVVLLEDLAAVLGVVVCSTCMGLTHMYGSHIPDAVGSLLVGGLLGGVASFIIYSNVAGLVGRSIPYDQLEKINSELESDIMVRAIHDVKGIDMGNFLVRYKAEIDFDGRELTRSYLDKQDLQMMLNEVRTFKDIDELESFMVKHGENIVDLMGGEIDRIELKLRTKHPDIRHCDLEIL